MLAYRSLVARLLRLHDPGAAAKALAAVLTVATTAALAAALRPAQEWCLGGGGGTGGGSGGFLRHAACWPVERGLVLLPESAGQVVAALALVALSARLLAASAEVADICLRCDGWPCWAGLCVGGGWRVAARAGAGAYSCLGRHSVA
jgi:hypothetical protein